MAPLDYLLANPTHTVLSIHKSDSERQTAFAEVLPHLATLLDCKVYRHGCMIRMPEGGTLRYVHAGWKNNKLQGHQCRKAFPEGAYPDLERLSK